MSNFFIEKTNKYAPTIKNEQTIGLDNAIDDWCAKRKLQIIPYGVFEPVLERCSEEQLAKIEKNYPRFEQETDGIWKKLCNKKFPETVSKDDEWNGSWKQCLKELTKREQQKHKRNIQARYKRLSMRTLNLGKRKVQAVKKLSPWETSQLFSYAGVSHYAQRKLRYFFKTKKNKYFCL